MLFGEDAFCQGIRGIAGQDRDFGLAEHFAAVEFLGDDMD